VLLQSDKSWCGRTYPNERLLVVHSQVVLALVTLNNRKITIIGRPTVCYKSETDMTSQGRTVLHTLNEPTVPSGKTMDSHTLMVSNCMCDRARTRSVNDTTSSPPHSTLGTPLSRQIASSLVRSNAQADPSFDE